MASGVYGESTVQASPMTRYDLLLSALVFSSTALSAQQRPHRGGFWVTAGLGYGSADSWCNECERSPRVGGTSAFFKAGGTVRPQLRAGASVDAWSHLGTGAKETIVNVTASLSYYPRARSGLFLEGGMGLSNYRVNATPGIDGTGLGITLGGGYDHRLGSALWLTPVFRYSYGGVGTVRETEGGPTFATGWKQDVITVGLGLTFR
jgi:opacity protein-like surface antigen